MDFIPLSFLSTGYHQLIAWMWFSFLMNATFHANCMELWDRIAATIIVKPDEDINKTQRKSCSYRLQILDILIHKIAFS